MNLNPEQVAEYARKDSLALKCVDFDDLLEEIRIRGTESNTLTRIYIIKKTKELSETLKQTYENSI